MSLLTLSRLALSALLLGVLLISLLLSAVSLKQLGRQAVYHVISHFSSFIFIASTYRGYQWVPLRNYLY